MTGNTRRPEPVAIGRFDTTGAVVPEYVVLISVCAIFIAAAIASLGLPLVNGYNHSRAQVISPYP